MALQVQRKIKGKYEGVSFSIINRTKKNIYLYKMLLGQGVFSDVILAAKDQDEVAIKVPRSERVDLERAVTDIKREIEIVKYAHHDHIIPYKGDGKVRLPNTPYEIPVLATNLLFDSAIHFKGKLPIQFIKDSMVSIADALHYCHEECGIFHRDVKPSNILFGPNKKKDQTCAYLCDFGLSIDISHPQQENGDRLDLYSGARGYAAPEIIACSAPDNKETAVKADQFSFGVCLWELLVGSHPFPRAKKYDCPVKWYRPLADPYKIEPDIPNKLGKVMKKVLSSPKKRYNSMSEVADALANV